MPTPMNSSQWAEFLEPIIRREWLQKLQSVKSPLEQFYGIEGSQSPKEYSQGIGALGTVPEFNSEAAEGAPGAIQYASFDPLYETTFTHKEYALGVGIERKLWDDLRTAQIKRRVQDLGHAFGTTMAVHMSSVLNNAFSSSYVGGDSAELCASDHPINKRSSDTFSNIGTTALSYDAMVTTLIAGNDQQDDKGNPMPVIYDTLYVPTALQGTAYEITQALNKPGTADNDANFLKGISLSVVVDPYLSDSNNWFMLNKSMAQRHLLWFWRVRPEIALDPQSNFNLVARYRGYMRYSYGWDDARWIFGHKVT